MCVILFSYISHPSEAVHSSSLEGLEARELFQIMTRLMKLLLLLVKESEVEGDNPELEFMAWPVALANRNKTINKSKNLQVVAMTLA